MLSKFLFRSVIALIFSILAPSLAFAWTPGLKEAAMAVAQGIATKSDDMMIFVHNAEFNLMAQAGELRDFSYAGAQSRFQEIQKKVLDDTFKNSPYRAEVSTAKLNPGTDTDVNVFRADGKPMTLDDIKAVEARYQRAARTHFDGESLPVRRIDTKTDFMPHPAHTTPEEFKRIAAHINANGGAAYSNLGAASAQAKLGSPAKISLEEAGAFQAEMKQLAQTRMSAAADLRRQAAAVGTSNPSEYARMQAQASQYEYQAAKYHERMSGLNNHLRKQYGLGAEKGAMDDVAKAIANIGRNPYSASQVGMVRDLHPKAMQSSSEQLINTLMDIAKKDPAALPQVRSLVNAEVRALHAAGAPRSAAQAALKMEQTVKQVESAAKWAAYKQTAKKVVAKIPVMVIAGGAILGYQGVQITLSEVKATDTLWDFFRNCYYHAAWEGTGIGTAFEQAQSEEIARYLKEFDAGVDPSMTKHVTFTLLKTGVYMGRDMIVGVLTLPDEVWEYFTQEKELEGYAAMQNDLARVMRQMVLDRKDFELAMVNMKKMGLHDTDAVAYFNCLCRRCGGSLGGFYKPGEACQCNGPLSSWKTPLPVGNKQAQYDCFNQVTKMRYEEARAIFDKWRDQMVMENAKSVQPQLDAIKEDIANGKAQEDEGTARRLADEFNAIKAFLLPQDLDHVQTTLGQHLEGHALRNLEAGNISRAVDNLNRSLKKVGTRNAQQNTDLEQRKAEYEKWDEKWREIKKTRFPQIDALVRKNQVQQAKKEMERLEHSMIKDPARSLPPAVKDPAFVALKERVAKLAGRYEQAMSETQSKVSALEESRDPRAAIPLLEKALAQWEHPPKILDELNMQLAAARAAVKKAEDKKALGQHYEKNGDIAQAIREFEASLEIQKDKVLKATLDKLRARQAAEVRSPATAKPVPGGQDYTASPPSDGPGYAAEPQSAHGLLATYPLDGDARDASGQSRHGTVHGAKPTADRFGQPNRAMYFDGRSHIELPLDINPAALPQLSFTAWVRADDASPVRQVMSHDNGGFDRSLGIDRRGGGSGWSAFSGSGAVLGFQPVEKGRWVFVSGVWDQNARKVRLHVDNRIFEKDGQSGGGRNILNLGRNPGYGEHFVGAIDDVRLFGRALSRNEVEAVRTGAANQQAGNYGSNSDQGSGPVTESGATGSLPVVSGNYLGCFKDTGDRDLSGYSFSRSGMTTQICLDTCQQKGFSYAGTQYSSQCFCGNSYGKYGKASNCNMPCSGNKTETCGGNWANSVYAIKR